MARCYVFFALIFLATLVVHASARPAPTTGAVDPTAFVAGGDGHVGDHKTFLPCIPRVPKAFAVAQNQQTSTFDIAPAPGAAAGTGLKDGKNFIYGGGVGGYAGMGGYAGFVGGFPVLGGIHYGGVGGVGGIGGLGGVGGGLGGAAGGAGGLLPCP